MESKVIKLPTVVHVKMKNGAPKLGGHISVKHDQDLKHIRFAAQRKGPSKMSAIVKNNKEILETRIA